MRSHFRPEAGVLASGQAAAASAIRRPEDAKPLRRARVGPVGCAFARANVSRVSGGERFFADFLSLPAGVSYAIQTAL